jgi:glutamine amidotransferase
MAQRIVIVDYDAGNLRSVRRAVEYVSGIEPHISADPNDIDHADALILPGVGAAADTMLKLSQRSLVEPVRDYIAAGRPFLGVCMGLQALFDYSEEGGRQECLGVLPGAVRRFPLGMGLKVPHMGWNTVHWVANHPIQRGIPDESAFYFVHSFYPDPADPDIALGVTEYGFTFPSIVGRANVVAAQFHPEKSGENGLRVYANFLDWAASGMPVGELSLAR